MPFVIYFASVFFVHDQNIYRKFGDINFWNHCLGG